MPEDKIRWIEAELLPDNVLIRQVTSPFGEEIDHASGKRKLVPPGWWIVRDSQGRYWQASDLAIRTCYRIKPKL